MPVPPTGAAHLLTATARQAGQLAGSQQPGDDRPILPIFSILAIVRPISMGESLIQLHCLERPATGPDALRLRRRAPRDQLKRLLE